jgi:hypothetical protein
MKNMSTPKLSTKHACKRTIIIIPENLLLAELPGQPFFPQFTKKNACKTKKGLFMCKGNTSTVCYKPHLVIKVEAISGLGWHAT